jgi:hypothetical protein
VGEASRGLDRVQRPDRPTAPPNRALTRLLPLTCAITRSATPGPDRSALRARRGRRSRARR